MSTRIIDDDAEGLVGLSFDPDGSLVGVDDLGTVFVWSPDADRRSFEADVDPTYGFAVDPRGERITVAGARTVELDLGSGAVLRALEAPAPGQCAAYVGARLLVGFGDGVLRAYAAEGGGAPRGEARVGERSSSIVALGDGRVVVSSASQGGSRLYFVDPETMDLDDLCTQAGLPVDGLSGAATDGAGLVAAAGRDLLVFSTAQRGWLAGVDAAGQPVDGPSEGPVALTEAWTQAVALPGGGFAAASPVGGMIWGWRPGAAPEALHADPAGVVALAVREGQLALATVDGRVVTRDL